MGLGFRRIRTEHAGAKNGGGYWGTREEAKRGSKRARRATGKAICRTELEQCGKKQN